MKTTKDKKMKMYVITLSRVFPVKHPLAGKPTFFKTKLENANVIPFDESNRQPIPDGQPQIKLHTIRENYPLWRKRFDEIEQGDACLSLREWTGKPYASKQIEIARLTDADGIGVQRLQFIPLNGDLGNFITSIDFRCHRMPEALNLAHELASKDGLTFADWKEWFFGNIKYDFRKPLAIIHFTKVRY